MKKNILRIAIVVLVGVLAASCGINEPTQIDENNLYGAWQEDGTHHYVRFLDETDGGLTYKYGREWDEDDDIYEADLKYHGNGWFKWELVQTNLTEIHLMDNGGAEIPKTYIVTKLTETELQYYEKDHKEKKTSFTKVVEKKN